MFLEMLSELFSELMWVLDFSHLISELEANELVLVYLFGKSDIREAFRYNFVSIVELSLTSIYVLSLNIFGFFFDKIKVCLFWLSNQ